MARTEVEISEFAGRSAEIIELAANGAEVILTEKKVPVAKLVPLLQTGKRLPGLHPGAMITSDDFDRELSDEIWSQ